MALPTKCQTPGAVFKTAIQRESVSITVELPVPLFLTEEEAELLEANLHNVLELVLKPYFRKMLI